MSRVLDVMNCVGLLIAVVVTVTLWIVVIELVRAIV